MQRVLVGLDIGGTKFMVAAADPVSLKPLETVREPTPAGLQEGLDLLHGMIGRVAGGAAIAGIGAAIGGPLDWQTGVVSPLHQPAWRDVPLGRLMSGRWCAPFRCDVDTNAAALGEYRFGGYTESRLLYLTLSTGMGGGFVVDGRLYRGGFGGAHPEAAHQAIPFRCRHPERVRCECGAPDCLEALVSGNGIRRLYGKPAEQLDDGEWAEVAWNLGQGLRNLAVLYAPDTIAIGGGLARQGERLLGPARQVMTDHLKLVPAPRVVVSRLGHDTALLGSLVLAQEAATTTSARAGSSATAGRP
jgi:predicted NBD/HSP70 family sugar kinase